MDASSPNAHHPEPTHEVPRPSSIGTGRDGEHPPGLLAPVLLGLVGAWWAAGKARRVGAPTGQYWAAAALSTIAWVVVWAVAIVVGSLALAGRSGVSAVGAVPPRPAAAASGARQADSSDLEGTDPGAAAADGSASDPAADPAGQPSDGAGGSSPAGAAGVPDTCAALNESLVQTLTHQSGVPFTFTPDVGGTCRAIRGSDGVEQLVFSAMPSAPDGWQQYLADERDPDGQFNCCMPDGGKYYTASGGFVDSDGTAQDWGATWWRAGVLYRLTLDNKPTQRVDVIVAATALDSLLRDMSS